MEFVEPVSNDYTQQEEASLNFNPQRIVNFDSIIKIKLDLSGFENTIIGTTAVTPVVKNAASFGT